MTSKRIFSRASIVIFSLIFLNPSCKNLATVQRGSLLKADDDQKEFEFRFKNGSKIHTAAGPKMTRISFILPDGTKLWSEAADSEKPVRIQESGKTEASQYDTGENPLWIETIPERENRSTYIALENRILFVDEVGQVQEYEINGEPNAIFSSVDGRVNDESPITLQKELEYNGKRFQEVFVVNEDRTTAKIFLLDLDGYNSAQVHSEFPLDAKTELRPDGIYTLESEGQNTIKIDVKLMEAGRLRSYKQPAEIDFADEKKRSNEVVESRFEDYNEVALKEVRGNLESYDQKFIDRVLTGLISRNLGGAAIVGDAGTGKSHFVDELVVATRKGLVKVCRELQDLSP